MQYSLLRNLSAPMSSLSLTAITTIRSKRFENFAIWASRAPCCSMLQRLHATATFRSDRIQAFAHCVVNQAGFLAGIVEKPSMPRSSISMT